MTTRELWIDYLRNDNQESFDAVAATVIPPMVHTLYGLPDAEMRSIIHETFEKMTIGFDAVDAAGCEIEAAFVIVAKLATGWPQFEWN